MRPSWYLCSQPPGPFIIYSRASSIVLGARCSTNLWTLGAGKPISIKLTMICLNMDALASFSLVSDWLILPWFWWLLKTHDSGPERRFCWASLPFMKSGWRRELRNDLWCDECVSEKVRLFGKYTSSNLIDLSTRLARSSPFSII